MKRALVLLVAGTLLSGLCAIAVGGVSNAAPEPSAIVPAPTR